MDKELNEDARTKQDLLYECSSLESKLSNEIIKNENLEQQCKKQKEVINKVIEYIEKDYYSKNTFDIDNIGMTTNKLLQVRNILKEVSE